MTSPTLAVDLGGTKTAVALIEGNAVLERRTSATDLNATAKQWIENAWQMSRDYRDSASTVAAAVSGIVQGNQWVAANADTLPVTEPVALVAMLERIFGLPAVAFNDAQAAAWGEYRFGAGQGKNIVYLTVSTGLGGGIVTDGRLWQGSKGVAGHFGVAKFGGAAPIEMRLSGRWMAKKAREAGFELDAKGVFSAAEGGAAWAQEIISQSAKALAGYAASIQLIIDPDCLVIGGGIGLVSGYLDLVRDYSAPLPDLYRPEFRKAQLGADAGMLGVSDLTRFVSNSN